MNPNKRIINNIGVIIKSPYPMKRIKRNPIMKKVEIIKIPYKPFRKTLYEDLNEIPY